MRRCIGLSFALVVFFCLLFVPTQAPAQQKVISLRFATFVTPMHQVSINLDQWAKEVEKRTNGRVKVTMHPSGTLAPAGQIYDSVMKSISDIGYAAISYTAGRLFCLHSCIPFFMINRLKGFSSIKEKVTMSIFCSPYLPK